MIAAYYHERRWDREGRVPAVLRRKLGLDDPAFGVDQSALSVVPLMPIQDPIASTGPGG